MENNVAREVSFIGRVLRVVTAIPLSVLALFFLVFSIKHFVDTFGNLGSGVTMDTPAEFGAAYGGFVLGPLLFFLSLKGIIWCWKLATKT